MGEGSKKKKKKKKRKEREILKQPKWFLYPIMINLYKGDLLERKVHLHQNLLFVFDCHLIQYQPLSNPLGSSSSTHSLQIYCIGLIRPRPHISFGLELKIASLQQSLSYSFVNCFAVNYFINYCIFQKKRVKSNPTQLPLSELVVLKYKNNIF